MLSSVTAQRVNGVEDYWYNHADMNALLRRISARVSVYKKVTTGKSKLMGFVSIRLSDSSHSLLPRIWRASQYASMPLVPLIPYQHELGWPSLYEKANKSKSSTHMAPRLLIRGLSFHQAQQILRIQPSRAGRRDNRHNLNSCQCVIAVPRCFTLRLYPVTNS